MMTATPRPVSIVRGKIFSGSWVSSTMLTESSKPTIEKKAIAVATVTAMNRPLSSGLSKTVIRAPMAGQVTGLKAEKGEMAIAGQTNLAGAVLMVISDLSEMMAELKVGELDVVKAKAGQPAEVSVDALPNRIFQGKVFTVASGTERPAGASFNNTQEAQTYKVRIRLEGRPEDLAVLRPGMSARIAILTAERKSVLAVPLAAIQERDTKAGGLGLMNGTRSVVFVVQDGKAQERPITMGLGTRRAAEVLEGLKEGEPVVTGPTKALPTLADGLAVKTEAPVR